MPLYFVFTAITLNGLEKAFMRCINYFGDEQVNADVLSEKTGFPLTNRIKYGTVLFTVVVICFAAQIEYAVNELGIFSHRPLIRSLVRLYDPISPLPGRHIFFDLYLLMQFVELVYVSTTRKVLQLFEISSILTPAYWRT